MTGGPLAPAAFAIPGDLRTLTGGYLYERRLLEGLRAAGRDVWHLRLPASFPDPSPAQMRRAVAQLAALPPDRPLILDGLVFASINTDGLARVAAPVVAMIHHPLALESGLAPARARHLFETERDNLRLARHVVVPSPHTRDILTGRYDAPPSKITIARPGVPPAAGPPRPTSPPLILSVGIQHPRKGHDILIAALEKIRDLDWRAVIVGRAWDRDHAAQLQDMALQSGLGPRLRLAGQIPAARLSGLYRAATVFALATRYEGYGIVFGEALRHGLPIVACATGAVPETVPAPAGLLVPPEDAPGFAAALRRMLEDDGLRRSCATASARAGADLPGWEDTAAIMGRVLDRLGASGA